MFLVAKETDILTDYCDIQGKMNITKWKPHLKYYLLAVLLVYLLVSHRQTVGKLFSKGKTI